MERQDTDTELPLSQEEDDQYLKRMIPNLSEHMRCIQNECNEIADNQFILNHSVSIKSEESPIAPLSPPQSPVWQQQQQPFVQQNQFMQNQMMYQIQQQSQWPAQLVPASHTMGKNQVMNAPSGENESKTEPFEVIPHDLSCIRKKGRYEFQLEFEKEKKEPSKSCPFTYSSQLNRLFVQRDIEVPFVFKTKIKLPKHAVIKCFLRFKDNRWKEEVVERCPVHMRQDKDVRTKENILKHVGDTMYTKSQTGHCCAIVQPNQLGENIIETFTFACASSCRGGINRRPIIAYFLLYVGTQLEGSANVEICICSCPGRDRRGAEKKLQELQNLHTTPAMQCSSSSKQPELVDPEKCHKRSASPDQKETEKPTKIIKFSSSSEDDDLTKYSVIIPPIVGKQNAESLVNICKLMVKKNEKSLVKMNPINEKDDTKDTPIQKLLSPVMTRSSSDPIGYQRKHRLVNIAIVSNMADE